VNTPSLLAFDGLLLISIVSLAWAALATRDARRSVILFMAFGLVLALAWGRLLAPDVALAEAAIGAGLSGALLLAAVGGQQGARSGSAQNAGHADPQPAVRWAVTLLCAGVAGILGWALLESFDSSARDTLAQAVAANLASSGVSNPVTAVLLNFRAYDTLLELAVLLTAVLGIFALGQARPGYRFAGPVFDSLARWLVPLLILTAGHLLWVGAHAPGGAFQAGATLAAAAVVLRLAGHSHIGLPAGSVLRLVMVAGVAVFLLVGVTLLALGRPFLGYPPAWAGTLILVIESAAMLSIAATLVLAFLGGRPQALWQATGAAESVPPAATATPAALPEHSSGAATHGVCKEEQSRC